MLRRIAAVSTLVLAALAALTLASPAAATIEGPCTAEIAGVDIGGHEVGATSDPIVVTDDRPISVTMESQQEIDRLEVELEFVGLRWTVHDRPSTGDSWASEVPVDDYATYGLGIYKVVASSSSASGLDCEGAALVEVAGENPLDPLKTPVALAALALALFSALGALALAVRVGKTRASPVFGGLLGALFAVGITVLLQQFSVVYPTLAVTGLLVAVGAGLGLALGLFGITGRQGDAR